MSNTAIAHQRLQQLQIATPSADTPAKVVSALGAVQAQDYAGAKWSIGLRLPHATDNSVETTLAKGSIVRTWALRNTLHFVAPADVHWMLDLLSHRMIAQHQHYYKQQELDPKTLRKSQQILQRSLEGGKHLTRKELADALEKNGIPLGDLRMNFITVRAAVDKIICQGARRGKEFTYTLLDEFVTPPKEKLSHDEALYRLSDRYFNSHGPATIKDFAWWAGITGTEAKRGLEMVQHTLIATTIDEQTYWMPPGVDPEKNKVKGIFLLPGFDEYLLGYTDRGAVMEKEEFKKIVYTANGLFNPTIVLNGLIVGTWKRTIKKDTVSIEIQPFSTLSPAKISAIVSVAKRYAKFLELNAALPFSK